MSKNQFRIHPQSSLNFTGELVIDSFAGGGGASTGIEAALGRPVDIAINHDQMALSMHEVNHPHTKHYCESVWDVDPRVACAGRPVGLAWFSPDCRHFSKAKGGKPVSPRVRGLAWVVLRWAATVKPKVIILENVEEFTTWGPLVRDDNGDMRPCKKRRGQTFKSFINALKRQGYDVQYRQLRACDYGAPTIRKRLFLVARCDGQPINWPAPTHGPGLKPYRTAAEIIDWSLPCPSIFERKKPLAEATCRRIVEGIRRFVIDSPNPFIIEIANYGGKPRASAIDTPLRTITAHPKGGSFALVSPSIVGCGGRAGQSRPRGPNEPFGTITSKADACLVTASIQRQFGNSVGSDMRPPVGTVTSGGGGKSALVTAWLAKHYTGVVGTDLRKPIGTVTSVDHHSLVTSHVIKLRGSNVGHDVREPLHTVSAGGTHHGEVRAFLMRYYSEGGQWGSLSDPMHTIPTKDRIGLVTVAGEPYQIVDIGMRMLQPHELFAAQGFPADYIHHRTADGTPINKTNQVRMCGNSVCPPLAEAVVRANMAGVIARESAA